jgi:hypothetical protein
MNTFVFTLSVLDDAGMQVAQTTNICTVVPTIYGPSVWNFVYVTFLVPRIFRSFLRCLQNLCTPENTFSIFTDVIFSSCSSHFSSTLSILTSRQCKKNSILNIHTRILLAGHKQPAADGVDTQGKLQNFCKTIVLDMQE